MLTRCNSSSYVSTASGLMTPSLSGTCSVGRRTPPDVPNPSMGGTTTRRRPPAHAATASHTSRIQPRCRLHKRVDAGVTAPAFIEDKASSAPAVMPPVKGLPPTMNTIGFPRTFVSCGTRSIGRRPGHLHRRSSDRRPSKASGQLAVAARQSAADLHELIICVQLQIHDDQEAARGLLPAADAEVRIAHPARQSHFLCVCHVLRHGQRVRGSTGRSFRQLTRATRGTDAGFVLTYPRAALVCRHLEPGLDLLAHNSEGEETQVSQAASQAEPPGQLR